MLLSESLQRDFYCYRAGFLVGALILVHTCLGQTGLQPHSQPGHSMSTGPAVSKEIILVDGALNPSEIPDDIAFLHFFRVLAKDPNAVNEQSDQDRRVSYVKYFFRKDCGQSGQDDRSLIDTEAATLLDYANRVTANLAKLNETGSAGSSVISSSASAAVFAAIGNLDAQLGPGVAQKVRSHVADHMKPAIKIVQSQIPAPEK